MLTILLRWLLPIACLVPAKLAPAADFTPAPLAAAQASADVALLRRALETIHPGLYRYSDRRTVEAAFARLEQSAATDTDALHLWRAIALMLARIHCDHTKPEAPATVERFRQQHPTHLPLRFRMIEGRMLVVSTDGQPGAPPAGSEILAINGQPVPRLLATLAPAVAYDGDTTDAIAAKLASDSDLMGDDLDEYWPAFFGFPGRWELDWKPVGAGASAHASLTPIDMREWTQLPWPGAAYRTDFYRSLAWHVNSRTAYLRLDSFVNYRDPVEPTAFLDGFFAALRSAGANHLILDLREAAGGSDDVAIALGRYLMHEDFVWQKPALLKAIRYGDLPQYIESWGDREALFNPPQRLFERSTDQWWQRLPETDPYDGSRRQIVSADRFRGRLTVLTGPFNASGATIAIAHLKEAGATLVGEATSGSSEGPTAGRIFLVTLPNSGIRVRIPLAWNRTAIAGFTPRLGVRPDRPVTPTYLDFLAGEDAALTVARAGPGVAPSLSTALAGNWEGSLEYRDYGNDRRVVLPSQAVIEAEREGWRASFVLNDGPGKTVRSQLRWRLSPDHHVLQVDGAVATVLEYRGGPGSDMVLVAEGAGAENAQAVRVRHVWKRRGDQLSLTSLSQRPGEPWLLRHSYWLRLQRPGPPPGPDAVRPTGAQPEGAGPRGTAPP